MDGDDDTRLPGLQRAEASAQAWRTMLECLSELMQQHSLQIALETLSRRTDVDQLSLSYLVHALAEVGPETDDEQAPALFGLEVVCDHDLRRAAATAYTELPAGEAIFARRQWRALLRVITAIDTRIPGLRGEVYVGAAVRAFAEYRVGDGTPLAESELQHAEAISLVLRYTHSFFRADCPGLGEAAYTLAPLALVEHLRGMFPERPGSENPFDPDATLSPFPGGTTPKIH